MAQADLPSPTEIGVKLRSQMPVVDNYAYFDHAAVGPLPAASAQAISRYAETAAACGDAKWLDWAADLADLRSLAAQMIGADKDEICFLSNTTQGLNLIAQGLAWERGDNVVFPENEFPSNSLPWEQLAHKGIEVRKVPVSECGAIDLNQLENLIDSKTRLLAISWVGFLSGHRINVKEVVELAHRRGALVSLDAIQGLGAFPLDVRESNVDFVCADGHKWMLGPEGAGFAYIKQEHLDKIRPVGIGWASLAEGSFEPGASRLKDNAGRFEGGSYNMPGLLGLRQSLQALIEAGTCIQDGPFSGRILELVAKLAEKLRETNFDAYLPEQEEHRSGILSVDWSGKAEPDFAAARRHLLRAGIVTSVRGGRIRIATHAYNTEEEIDRLINTLVEYRQSND